MRTELKVTNNLTVNIEILEGMVLVTTDYYNYKRTTSYDSVEDAIDQTTLPSVHNFLKSI
jgi:hypothetical protein